MTFEQVIRAAMPDADAATIEHILWGRTPFPMGQVTAQTLYRAASQWRRAMQNGLRLCDYCDKVVSDPREFQCQHHTDVLRGLLDTEQPSP